MPVITFRLTPRQFVMQLVLVAVAVACGVGVAAVATGVKLTPVGVVAPAVGGMVGSSMILIQRVTLTAFGVAVRKNGTRQIPWQAIRYIDTKRTLGTTLVRLHLFDGKIQKLPAPLTWFAQPDPEFATKLAALQQWWMYYTGQFQPPVQQAQPPSGQIQATPPL
jgi:hypothetical protein